MAKQGREMETREAAPLSVVEIKSQVQLIQQVMKEVMQDGHHYGKIPGCGDKPTLLKPGAEKLCMTFRLAPSYIVEAETREGGHYTVRMKCRLTHITTGRMFGEGMGSATTRESKHAFRDSKKCCPKCGAESIRHDNKSDGGGWYCWGKIGGCGAKFPEGDKEITEQKSGKVANENTADQENTVLKMACKRAQVAAVLNATAASDIFTQDLEDMADAGVVDKPPSSAKPATPPAQTSPANGNGTKTAAMKAEDWTMAYDLIRQILGHKGNPAKEWLLGQTGCANITEITAKQLAAVIAGLRDGTITE